MSTPNRFRFRAWDSVEKHFIDPERYSIYAGGFHWEPWASSTPHECIVLQQSTGLLDKNGVEIFEGDILSQATLALNPNSMPAVVKWKNGCFCFDIITLAYALHINGRIPETVIGNKYENPDLLKP